MTPWNVVEDGGFHYFIQGDVRVPLDKGSCAMTVQNTKKLNIQTMQKIMNHNDLEMPLETPFEIAWPVVASFIQLAWHKKFLGKIEQRFSDRHSERVNTFKQAVKDNFVNARKSPTRRDAKIHKKFVCVGEPGGATQLKIIMEELKKIQPATLDELVAATTRRGISTRQPVERVVRFYLYKEYGTRFKEDGCSSLPEQEE